jgi:hypothetical protein
VGIWSGPTLTRQAESVRRATSAFTRVFDLPMHLVAEYLEKATPFEPLAEHEQDPRLKKSFLEQASACRMLAESRAKHRNLPLPPKS